MFTEGEKAQDHSGKYILLKLEATTSAGRTVRVRAVGRPAGTWMAPFTREENASL